jgi:hypothetical protein
MSHPKILEHPLPFKKSDVEDTIVNIVGFIPFGFSRSVLAVKQARGSLSKLQHRLLISVPKWFPGGPTQQRRAQLTFN